MAKRKYDAEYVKLCGPWSNDEGEIWTLWLDQLETTVVE